MGEAIAVSETLANAVWVYCLNQERREDNAQMTVCFDLKVKTIASVLAAAYKLSLETYEGRRISGGFLFVRDADALFEQVKSWRVAVVNVDVPNLSFRGPMKHVAGVLTRDTWLVLGPAGSGFRLIGLVRQRHVPLHEVQSGAMYGPIYEHPPLAISIEGPGDLTVSINHVVIGGRRGDEVWTSQARELLIFAALAGCTGHWGDPHQTAALFGSVRHEMELQRRGGTMVIGPRVDIQDRSIIQPGAIPVSGLSASGVVMGDFAQASWSVDALRSDPVGTYREYAKARRRGEELRDLLVAMMSVDGAVLIDTSGEVYAYHAYFALQGDLPTHDGEGSRHRTLRAFMARTKSWLALGVSQDGITTGFAWDHDVDRLIERQSRYGMSF